MENILSLQDISVDFFVPSGKLRAVDNVSLDIKRGEIMGIIGESGSGKSTLASTILNIISIPGKITKGSIIYNGENILEISNDSLNKFRWEKVAHVFQAAQNALNPVLTIKEHMLETAWAHDTSRRKEDIINEAERLLEYVRLNGRQVLNSYPHQLSGGMKQRAVIALSLLLNPEVLILDEPTTALDVITQWYIIDILKKIHKDLNLTMIFLTHDVSIIGNIADRITVMYGGQIVEYGPVEAIYKKPTHPYTYGLMYAVPSLFDDLSQRRAIPGIPPDLINPPAGCRFSPRCDFHKNGICDGSLDQHGKFYESGEGQYTKCLHWKKVNSL